MRVLIGGFVAECNAFVQKPGEIEDFVIDRGEKVIDRLYIRQLAEENHVELVPTLYASAAAIGVVSADTFDYFLKQFVRAAQEHKHDVDGMFFFFHGASNVEGLEGGSGDHALIQQIRRVVGPYMPIAMVMDPHGNLSQQQADNCNIIRTFRHSPHTDRREAHEKVFTCLLDVLNHRRIIHPVYRKVPIMLGGERCVSTDEPLVSINRLLDQIEADPRILCCSYHIGYVRHDSDKCGASVIVVPNSPKDKEYAEQKADEIYEFVMSRRHEFHFTGKALDPEPALEAMISQTEGPLFLTDSGDNVTAGAPGENTLVLRQLLKRGSFGNKNILFAAITDKPLYDQKLDFVKDGSNVSFELGTGRDELTAKVPLSGTVISHGALHRHYHDEAVVGGCCAVKLDDVPVTVIIGNSPVSFAERVQYEWAKVDMDQYDLIIVKQGYLYPELKAMAHDYIMSLTPGACYQRTETFDYKCIARPMYPYDDDFD